MYTAPGGGLTARMERARLAAMEERVPYIVSVQGLKNSGKTTVTEALIASLLARGYRTGSVKVTGHVRLDLDARGTDTFRQAEAGAEFVLARSETETFLLQRGRVDPAPLFDLAAREVQFVICEGCRDPAVGSYILCLGSFAQVDEALRERSLTRTQVIAFSGAAAGEPRRPEAYVFYDVRLAGEREALVDLLVAAAGAPPPAGRPSGPLAGNPGWLPGSSH